MYMRALVLAEKPSLMRAIQTAYKSGGTFPFVLDFAAFHGHLMRLAEPAEYNPDWKTWNTKDLPLIPDPFRYMPDDKASIEKIMATIRSGKYDFLVNACDAEREGELIFWSFYEANHLTLPVKRLWCSTTLPSDLEKALRSLKDASAFQHLREAAAFRAQFDWLAGMNFSRAISLKSKKKSNIGRVVTPTLKMVVDRELEIQKFVPQSFYELGVALEKGDKFPGLVLVPPELKQTRFPTEAAVKTAQASLGTSGIVEGITSKRTATKAPTLYSTTELQKDANKYYKFRASKTDSIAQDLYEAGYISYPRTSCRFISTSMVSEIPNLLKPLSKFPELADGLKLVTAASITKATSGKDYINDAKLTDHHAIIPTGAVFDPAKLSDDQRKIYLLIAKRFLSIFLPPYVVDTINVIVDSNGQKIKAAGRTVIDKGFSILYQDKSKDVILPVLNKGDSISVVGSKIRAGTTKPPERYTDKTLLEAMANAGKFVSSADQRAILREAEGIGTPATRSAILEKLESTKMCTIEKGAYVPTAFGMELVKLIQNRDIASPAITAEWEKKLRNVQENGHPEVFKAEMIQYIKNETQDILDTVSADLSSYRFETIGKCPICGRDVIASDKYYRCVNYKADTDPCTFLVNRNETWGIKLSINDMKTMLSGKATKQKMLVSKAGRKFTASLIIKDGKIAPAFGQNKKQGNANADDIHTKEGICTCPCCGKGQVYARRNYYTCSAQNDGCGFIVGMEICSAPITEQHIKALSAGEVIGPLEFTWKSGKKGLAKLKGHPVTEGDKTSFKLEFVFA